jgi:hypothetical protein
MDVPVKPAEGKNSLDQDIPALRGVADLYVQAKGLILYSEEVDPESRSNLPSGVRRPGWHRVVATRQDY